MVFFASVGPWWILRVSVCLSHNNCAWVEVLSQLGMRDGAGLGELDAGTVWGDVSRAQPHVEVSGTRCQQS